MRRQNIDWRNIIRLSFVNLVQYRLVNLVLLKLFLNLDWLNKVGVGSFILDWESDAFLVTFLVRCVSSKGN